MEIYCDSEEYLTTGEIAKLFNVTPTTVYRWEDSGLIKSYRVNPRGRKLFLKKEIFDAVSDDGDNVLDNLKNLDDCDALEIGTKAKNIKIIKEKGGCKIPKTIIINVDAFKKLIIKNKIYDPLSFDWLEFGLPEAYQKSILDVVAREFGSKPLVVRSSATCEDSPLLSFAGQYSSFLNITGSDNIINAIKLCYQSLFGNNAKMYAKMNGVRLEYESMAIAIQELVPVTIAGVVFTADPVSGDNNEIVIEYTEGLGDSVVSGSKKPIVKKINKNDISQSEPGFLREVIKAAIKLEDVFGNPQDIEWGWDGNELYIFQSRNITTLDKCPKIFGRFQGGKILGSGNPVCRGMADGRLLIVEDSNDYDKIKKGDIVLMKCKMDISLFEKISYINGLVIWGGVLSHIAVVAREFNIPCLTEPIINVEEIRDYQNENIIIDAINGNILLK